LLQRFAFNSNTPSPKNLQQEFFLSFASFLLSSLAEVREPVWFALVQEGINLQTLFRFDTSAWFDKLTNRSVQASSTSTDSATTPTHGGLKISAFLQ